MNIGLLAVDSNYPNLALMNISPDLKLVQNGRKNKQLKSFPPF